MERTACRAYVFAFFAVVGCSTSPAPVRDDPPDIKKPGTTDVEPVTPSPDGRTPDEQVQKRPNIVFILTDDQRWDAMGCVGHPFLKTPNMDRICSEGVRFVNAFVTTSLCSPSRASFLTGAYAHSHGVIGNWGCEFDHDNMPSFPRALKESGYETAYVGKWHMGRGAHARPGFDYWLSFRGQGVYTNPTFNENGREFKATGYVTDLLTDHAVEFIKKERKKPFALYLSHKAVHGPFTPAPRHKNSYPGAEIPEPPNARDTFKGKPAWLRGGIADPRRKNAVKDVPEAMKPKKYNPAVPARLNYMRALSAVDEGIGRIFKVLEEEGELDNTVIMFAGDNGYFHGEHGRGDKRLMYEESLRIPLLMRYPAAAKPGSIVEQLVLNIDVAPTLLELAGVAPPATVQGRSTVPLLAGNAEGWRTSFLYEYWVDMTDRIPHMLGVRTEGWKLIRYPDIDDIDEMYDLRNDPHEMTNLALQPEHAEKRRELSVELDRMMKETGYGSKPIPEPPPIRRKGAGNRRKKRR